MSEDGGSTATIGQRIVALSDKMLATRKASNALIVVLILMVAMALWGVGIFATRPIPLSEVTLMPKQALRRLFVAQAATAVSAAFNCTEGKHLTVHYGGDNAILSLSDGRELDLPRLSTTGGELRYGSARGDFLFVNSGNSAYVQESGVKTYADCVSR